MILIIKFYNIQLSPGIQFTENCLSIFIQDPDNTGMYDGQKTELIKDALRQPKLVWQSNKTAL